MDRGVGPLWIAGDQLSLLLILLLFTLGLQLQLDARSEGEERVGQERVKDGRPVCPQCPAASSQGRYTWIEEAKV